ncbi:transmembrane protein 32 [Cordyceps javanica]|nr:transmembrane protein 32 [Cordyceps javanica]
MTWLSKSVTVTGLLLLAHACYSAQEHATLTAAIAKHSLLHQQTSSSLPVDISIEAIVATLVVCVGLASGSQTLRPIQWNVWAGKIEREGDAGFLDGSGDVDKDFRGSPFAFLHSRPGFVDIRKERREFTEWVKSEAK